MFGGEWLHIYVWLSPLAAHLKLSQHCLWAIHQYKIETLRNKPKRSLFYFVVFLCIICVKSFINLLQYIAYSQLCQLGTSANFFELMNKLDLQRCSQNGTRVYVGNLL